MKGRVPAEKLRGKRVLIGATAIELGDRYAVPRYGVVPGVVFRRSRPNPCFRTARSSARAGVTILRHAADRVPAGATAASPPGRYAALCGTLLLAVARRPGAGAAFVAGFGRFRGLAFHLDRRGAVQAIVEARRRLRLRAQFDAESGLPNRSVLEKALGSGSNGANCWWSPPSSASKPSATASAWPRPMT